MPITDPLAVYIHWPFCVSKCPYCDFNSHVAEWVDHAQWREAYAREIAHYAVLTPGRVVTSIFFGGGTPSLMQPETVAAVIDCIAGSWPIAPDVEITAEANPGSIDQAVFEGFAGAGVNRVSIGVQSFDDNALQFLGRKHGADEARRAIDLAARYFPRFSIDLIYARPGQSIEAWDRELDEALSFSPSHMSAYQLTIEQGTKFEGMYRQGAFILPHEDLAVDLYEHTNARLSAAGLNAYEVSNYAAPGRESRHNLTYWRYGDYVGVGPGAHGRLTLDGCKVATRAHRAPDEWLRLVAVNGHGAHEPVVLTQPELLQEVLMMGLRLQEPMPLERFQSLTGRSLTEWCDPKRLARLESEGLLRLTANDITLTAEGRLRLNAVLGYMLPDDVDISENKTVIASDSVAIQNF